MNRDEALSLASEPTIPLVKGTADWLPADHARLARLEETLLREIGLAGYERMTTPILEPVVLHELKSGAGIVGKLFELAGLPGGRTCLRPELTAGVVRAYVAAEPPPPLPWRVSHAGPAFRREDPARPDRLREFRQVGVERLGDSGVLADAEVIALAWSSIQRAGAEGATLRLGHVGLTLEMLARSGLPPAARAALVEMLSEAAAEGGDVGSLGRGLEHFAEWLRRASEAEEIPQTLAEGDEGGVDRLFRTLVPVVNGRRTPGEIVGRLRRKWDLGHSWLSALDRVRDQARELAGLKGPPGEVLDRLAKDFEGLAPDSVASLRALVGALDDHGVPTDRIELDLGFGRGIGFYSQAVFEVIAPTPGGPVEVCGGGRYDGLARVFGSDRDDRGAGFAFGLERLDAVLKAQGRTRGAADSDARPCVLVVAASPENWKEAAGSAGTIRISGVRAILEAGWQGREVADRARALGATHLLSVGGPSGAMELQWLDGSGRATRRVEVEGRLGLGSLMGREVTS